MHKYWGTFSHVPLILFPPKKVHCSSSSFQSVAGRLIKPEIFISQELGFSWSFLADGKSFIMDIITIMTSWYPTTLYHPFKHFARVLTSNTDYHQEDDSGTEVADSEPDGSEPSVSSNCEERALSVFMRFLALVSASTSSMVRLSRLLSAETETSQEKSNSTLPSPPCSLWKLKQDKRNRFHVSHVVLIFTNTFPCPPPVILLAVCCNWVKRTEINFLVLV